MTAITSVPDLVNLDRYPIDSLDSEPGAALVERGRQALASGPTAVPCLGS